MNDGSVLEDFFTLLSGALDSRIFSPMLRPRL